MRRATSRTDGASNVGRHRAASSWQPAISASPSATSICWRCPVETARGRRAGFAGGRTCSRSRLPLQASRRSGAAKHDEPQHSRDVRKPRRQMIARRRACPILAVAAPLWLCGCANTVFPPQHVTDPVQVGVLDHGQHTSLIVEIPGDGMRRYSYGDWQWYALRQTGPLEGTSAVFLAEQGGARPQAAARPVLPGRGRARGPRPDRAGALPHRRRARRPRPGRSPRPDLPRQLCRADRQRGLRPGVRAVSRAVLDLPQLEPGGRGMARAAGCRVEGPALFAVWRLGAGAQEARLALR